MIRTVVVLFGLLILVTLVRAFVSLVSQLFQPPSQQQKRAGAASSGGELKQCANCGVYASASTSLQKREGDKVLYFCSPACRDRYTG